MNNFQSFIFPVIKNINIEPISKSLIDIQPMQRPVNKNLIIPMKLMSEEDYRAERLMYKYPFKWNKTNISGENTLDELNRMEYNFYKISISTFKKYFCNYSFFNDLSTKYKRSLKLCIAKSCDSSWLQLAGREYIVLYDKLGNIIQSHCLKLS